MNDLELRDSLRPLGRDILEPDIERRQAAIRSAFDPTGQLKASALRLSLPPLLFSWFIDGTLSAGTNVADEIELPGPVRLTNLVVRVKSAPSGTCNLRLTANGTTIATANIPIGQTRGRVAIPADLAVRAAGEVLRVDVVNAGSAANASVIAAYTVVD
jgi:hypothetical protein